MVKVSVKVFAFMREQMGWDEREFEVGSGRLDDLLIDEETGNLTRGFRVLVNGRDIDFLRRFETMLGDGDRVVVFPPVAGGSDEAKRTLRQVLGV